MCVFIHVCDLCDGSLFVCVKERQDQIDSGLRPPEGDKETHLEPEFGDWTNMYVLYVYACFKIHPC